jgi:hypothetical protein
MGDDPLIVIILVSAGLVWIFGSLWLIRRFHGAWLKIGEGQIETVIRVPPAAPTFIEPLLGAYLTRSHLEVRFTNGETCTVIGQAPDLEPGQKVTIRQNYLGEIDIIRL